ncbi:hypothetical protein CNMCM8980_002689 [Aspergillus fumigatiaffinis]|jgi:hypothetical protein|uniref:Uncharacterized protein n=1 Tax=Aspergillus fumigatiaffinis TaxID=340414 RepID=A0A8H4GX23_9EURO|nr:hypothetical protein CNMCM6805_000734 [Aspergillus fumigatiaffinis]KAF4236903.1 hypothetical protein CNMCM8980_002689 [Aspergillus fumigatiaffinis]
MSRVPVRGFQTASKQAINWIGNVTVTDVVQMNNDPQWENALTSAAANVEAQNPKVVDAKIQGALAHPSSRDKEEKEKIVTVGFYSARGTRLLSSHIRRDGSYKSWESRAGKR